MKRDNRLVAYIQSDNNAPYIDIVKISKKGTSFYYADVWWARGSVMSSYCTNDKGKKLKITPLSHSNDLYKNHDGVIEVKESAKERYINWLKREIN